MGPSQIKWDNCVSETPACKVTCSFQRTPNNYTTMSGTVKSGLEHVRKDLACVNQEMKTRQLSHISVTLSLRMRGVVEQKTIVVQFSARVKRSMASWCSVCLVSLTTVIVLPQPAVRAEVFTALVHMEGLISLEKELLGGLQTYLDLERKR